MLLLEDFSCPATGRPATSATANWRPATRLNNVVHACRGSGDLA